MKRVKQQKAITLIALIITIIILLILAVVTIGSINNSNIIKYAQNAGADYSTKKGEEESILSEYESLIKDNLQPTWTDNGDGTFTSIDGTVVAIGDYVDYSYDKAEDYEIKATHSGANSNQTPSQTENLKWRVLGINEKGMLQLISAEEVENGITFWGPAAYNNGVYLLNDICKSHYSNAELGIIARSLTIEDLEKQYSEEAIIAKNEYRDNNWNVQYGTTKECKKNWYPTLYAEEAKSGVEGFIRDGGIGISDPFYENEESLSLAYDENGIKTWTTSIAESGKNIIATQTCYNFYDMPSSYFKNETFYNMIFISKNGCWLASRCVDVTGVAEDDIDADFGLYMARSNNIYRRELYTSGNTSVLYGTNFIRPVVTLPSDVSIITNNETNSSTNMWTLSK